MVSIFLQILVCGIATAAICRTVVHYDGPFNIIPRFKNSLLPKSDILTRTWDIKTYQDLQDSYTDVVMTHQESDGQLELWKTYHLHYNHKYYQSLKGTIYGVLDCVFCLGPYVSGIMALISTSYLWSLGTMSLTSLIINWAMVMMGTYGIHFSISKRWES